MSTCECDLSLWLMVTHTLIRYMFPCPTCGNPSGQVDAMLSALNTHGIHSGGSGAGTYGTVWLDIGESV